MSAKIGTATHVYGDGSKHELRVEIEAKGTDDTFPAAIGEPYYFDRRVLDNSFVLYIASASQARDLARLLDKLADRLEARGE